MFPSFYLSVSVRWQEIVELAFIKCRDNDEKHEGGKRRGNQVQEKKKEKSDLSTTMESVVKMEESELKIVGGEYKYLDVMQPATSALLTDLDIKNELDTDIDTDSILASFRIKHEHNCNNIPITLNNCFKIEKNEPELYVEETSCYINTMQLSKELNIKNEICADSDKDRLKTEHSTKEWNESALSMSNIMVKPDPDANMLHTEFDMKTEGDPSTSAVPTR
nr:unnamed protein product [Callosobruchus analis]